MSGIEKDRIRVVVRVRPLNPSEFQNGENEIVVCEPQSVIVSCIKIKINRLIMALSKIRGKSQAKKFLFDSVFDPNATQDDVFEYSGIKRLVNMAIDGFLSLKINFKRINFPLIFTILSYICTCFAYGQTGSGKT